MKDTQSRLKLWQDRLSNNQDAYNSTVDKFDERERLVKGDDVLQPSCENDTAKKAYHVRNICAEMIESQVDANVPAPKVTARRKEDEPLAKIIEDMLNDELNRMPFETYNDIMERTVPIQGGSYFLLEWDNALRTHDTIGELTCMVIHPKQIVPQDGVFTCVEDMDYIILKLPQTKEDIKRRYNVDVSQEAEEEPEIRGWEGESSAPGLVTQYVAYYRNEDGGIGLFSWVNDTILEDLDDYQSRRLRRCKQCGAVEPLDAQPLNVPSMDGTYPGGDRDVDLPDDNITGAQPKNTRGKTKCPYCGGNKWEDSIEDYEEVYLPKMSSQFKESKGQIGVELPGAKPILGADGMPMVDETGEPIMEPIKIPYYKPNIYPVILQKSVSMFGQLLGDSDIDKIRDQQNTVNRIWTKIMDMTIKAGSIITLPNNSTISSDNTDCKIVRLEKPEEKYMIDKFDLQSYNEIQTMAILEGNAYEEARQCIGITDSYQGRKDNTATSGKAKEFSAQQAAGRLESKRVMKEAAYAQLFEAMFKFKLAYSDEPRSIMSHDENGEAVYEMFDRYDFLKQDEAGEYYWNDQFLFECDPNTPLARDRQSMWQETRMNFQDGTFGDPSSLETLILFWTKMETLHYPDATATKKYLQGQLEKQQMMQQQQMMMQQNMQKDAMVANAAQNILAQKGKNNGNQSNQKANANKQNKTSQETKKIM